MEISILHVNSLLSAIPRTWISKIEKSGSGYNEIPVCSNYKKLSKTDFRGKEPRFILGTFKKDYNATNSRKYLDRSFPFLEQVNWAHLFTYMNKVTSEPYLQSFQYKITNRTLNCNYNLFKWNILDHSTCVYCPLVILLNTIYTIVLRAKIFG